ncbi:MAG: 16S rRNA (guanine(527)-N(7))-methyltransferase RsmG [Gammaproteobacteria bacterium]|nr:16S rRNA (guanine(527)-N(7))-methyltransferase RsmG [Gammaproteobacteria bacterium]
MQGASSSLTDATEIEVALSPEQALALDAYANLVRRWNPMLGLVASKDLPRFADRHVVDGLVAAQVLRDAQGSRSCEGLEVLDLGSGAGLPGVPLAVSLPEASVTLVECSARKSRFLRLAQRELGLANVFVLCAELRQVPSASADVVTARALMPPPALWGQAHRILRPGGHMLALDRVVRSRKAAAAVADSPADFPGGSIARRHWAKMPISTDRRVGLSHEPTIAPADRPPAGLRHRPVGLSAWHGLLVVTKDDPDHSGGKSEGRRRQDHDER